MGTAYVGTFQDVSPKSTGSDHHLRLVSRNGHFLISRGPRPPDFQGAGLPLGPRKDLGCRIGRPKTGPLLDLDSWTGLAATLEPEGGSDAEGVQCGAGQL